MVRDLEREGRGEARLLLAMDGLVEKLGSGVPWLDEAKGRRRALDTEEEGRDGA
jgi:hypothetical protein